MVYIDHLFIIVCMGSAASAYINLGVHLAQTGRLEEAVDIWKSGLEQWNRSLIVAFA